jgi:hypothetical protein
MDERTRELKRRISKELWMKARACAMFRNVDIDQWFTEAVQEKVDNESSNNAR